MDVVDDRAVGELDFAHTARGGSLLVNDLALFPRAIAAETVALVWVAALRLNAFTHPEGWGRHWDLRVVLLLVRLASLLQRHASCQGQVTIVIAIAIAIAIAIVRLCKLCKSGSGGEWGWGGGAPRLTRALRPTLRPTPTGVQTFCRSGKHWEH